MINTREDIDGIHKLANRMRKHILDMALEAGASSSHFGGGFSIVDITATLYGSIMRVDATNPELPERDRFILSKGHAAAALYAVLAYKGFITEEELLGYGRFGSLLEEHPSPKQIGVEAATGSLGHGLPIANGMALARKINKRSYRVFVLLGDGECNEGSVWEAAMFAAGQELSCLSVVVDFNKWQATGRSREVMELDSLADKWKSFGWNVQEIDGHDHKKLYDSFASDSNEAGRPSAYIAHTTKGKGISFMEDDNNWHYRVPSRDDIESARIELGLA